MTPAPPWLMLAFPLLIAAETATRLWLATRQISAVSAHRDRVPAMFAGHIELAEQQKAADYTVARMRLTRVATVAEAALKLVFTVGGGIAALAAAAFASGWPEPWRGLALLAAVFLVAQLFGLPFALHRIFRLESRFGFNRTSPRLFAADFFKQLLLAALLGGPLALATLLLMERGGRWWWLWAWGVLQIASVGLAWAAPRFIAPLFNRFAPLTDATLAARVQALLERCGYTARGGVFVMDGSRRSAHGNAYFTGIGSNKRIVFLDTLLARVDADEIEAVLAHELGHFRLRHVRDRLFWSMGVMLVGLALLAALAREPLFYAALGVSEPSPAAALLLFSFAVPVLSYFVTPLGAWWSRRQELAADDFAAAHADAQKLGSALVKLYRDNASTLTPDPLHSAFYDSHPPATQRISRLRALAAR
jgi:STE24 endopeptidase